MASEPVKTSFCVTAPPTTADLIAKTLQETRSPLGDKNAIDRNARSFIDQMLGETKTQTTKNDGNGNRPISTLIEGTNASSKVKGVVSSNGGPFGGGKQSITHDGNVTFNFNFTGDGAKNLSPTQMEQVTKEITNTLRSTNFLQASYNNANPGSPIKVPKNNMIGQ